MAGAAVTLVSILILKWVLSPLFAQDPETVQAKTPLAPPSAQETPGELLAVSKQPVATAREPRIRRATFASDVVEHEPVDALGERIASWPDAPRPVYMFTDLQNLAGQSVYHRWYWQIHKPISGIRPAKLIYTLHFEILAFCMVKLR